MPRGMSEYQAAWIVDSGQWRASRQPGVGTRGAEFRRRAQIRLGGLFAVPDNIGIYRDEYRVGSREVTIMCMYMI